MKTRVKACVYLSLLVVAGLLGCNGLEEKLTSTETEFEIQTNPIVESEEGTELDLQVEKPILNPFDQKFLENCTLTIYYDDALIFRLIPLSLEDLLDEETIKTHHVSVPGIVLKDNVQFLSLLESLEMSELPQVQASTDNYPSMMPTIYYILTTSDGQKILDVSIGWGNLDDEESRTVTSVYFNGEKIPFDMLFYSSVEDYLEEPHYIPGFRELPKPQS